VVESAEWFFGYRSLINVLRSLSLFCLSVFLMQKQLCALEVGPYSSSHS